MNTKNIDFIINLSTINTIISKKLDTSLGAIHGISFSEYMILSHIITTPNKMMRRIDLAEQVGLTASGITRAIAPMEKIGLLEKKQNERDARVSLVKISSTGERIFKEATLTLEEKLNLYFENIKEKEFANIPKVLKIVGNNIGYNKKWKYNLTFVYGIWYILSVLFYNIFSLSKKVHLQKKHFFHWLFYF